jgi:hypothetical protein
MPAFSITPVAAFPPASSDGFPRFIQFKQDGTNVGDTAVQTVDFTGDVALTLSSDGSTVTVEVGSTPFSWLDVPGDYTVQLTDMNLGLRTSGGTGNQVITVPPPSTLGCSDGDAVLVRQQGAAGVTFVVPSGSNPLAFRSDVFNAAIAGQYGIVTLIADLTTDDWTLCGDLEAV